MPQPLRIAYTLEQCWHDVPGGSAVAALEVLRRLIERDDVEMIGVAGRHRADPATPYVPPVPVRQLAIGRPWLYEAWNRIGWPRVERATGPIDVCHTTIAIPARTVAPHVVTVHDVAFVHTPDLFSPHGVRVMLAGLERCRAADLVLVPSRATADDVIALGFDASRVRVVPWGVDTHRVTDTDVARVRARHALPERFVLFVGTLEPRKNLARLAQAVARLDESIPLLVAGANGWGDAAPAGDHVRFLGFVAADDLPALYACASVFAYPSLQEGFGMPILEAMAHGAPVVTSRGSSTEEVAAGAAALADPHDVDSIAVAISSVLADRPRWVGRGAVRVAESTWDATVDATVEAYRAVAARSVL